MGTDRSLMQTCVRRNVLILLDVFVAVWSRGYVSSEVIARYIV
jgi:hypothetical protein